jgi:hypothetical protein
MPVMLVLFFIATSVFCKKYGGGSISIALAGGGIVLMSIFISSALDEGENSLCSGEWLGEDELSFIDDYYK